MATHQDLISLQRKIALDSYHQTTRTQSSKPRNRSTTIRPRSLSSTDPSKPILLKSTKSSNRSNKSRSKDTALLQTKPSSHLPSMTKPFKKIFKRPNKQENNNTSDNNYIGYGHHIQSRSFTNNSYSYKLKSKSKKSKHNSDSQLSINIKKLIDKKLLHQYQQYVEERVEMLRSHAFPHEVIYQLSQYRTDLTDSLNKSIPKVYFSRHKEADALIQLDLLRAKKKAQKHTTKLHKNKENKTSIRRTIKKGIVAPIKPIKNLFITKDSKENKSNKNNSQITHLSYTDYENKTEISDEFKDININKNLNALLSPNSNLEHKFNIQISDNISDSDAENITKESTNSISNEPNISISQISDSAQLIASLSVHKNNKMEIIKDNNVTEITPCAFPDNTRQSTGDINGTDEPQFMHSQTVNVCMNDINQLDKSVITRAKTSIEQNGSSPTPPFFKVRTANVRNATENVFDDNLRSNTPSWALRDNSVEMDEQKEIIRKKSDDTIHTNDSIYGRNELDVLEGKYNELELVCQDLQINLRSMKENINEQNDTIRLLTQQMHEMEGKLNAVKYVNNNNENGKEENKNDNNMKENGNNNKYFDYGYFWDMFKQKFEEKDIISFERTKWENIYHSLFAYFMNGLMVIFTILMRLYMLIVFVFTFVLCCLCKKNRNHKYKNKLSDTLSNNSRNVKRRNKKRILQTRVKNS